VEGHHGGGELGVPQGALDEPGVHARCKPRGGVGRPERREGPTCGGDPSPVCGGAAGALDTGATPGSGRGWPVVVMPPGSGQEPGLVTGGVPGGAEQQEGLCGEGDVAVLRALAAGDRDLAARAIAVRALQGEGVLEPASHARDGGAGDVGVEGGGGREEPPHLLHTPHGGETVGGGRAHAREGVPVAVEDVLGEEAQTTVPEAHGRGGQAIDVCAVEESALQCQCCEPLWRLAVALREEAPRTDRGRLGPLPRATALQRSDHVLTQWGHGMSPCMSRRVVRLRRKTS